ncbi:MAG TPA: RNA methyltransferase substrate-binding domain-containing protein, partial [Anaerolineales bacterium]
MITSSQNPKLKLVRALLGRPKERREEEAFVAEGVRLLEEAQSAKWPVRFVLYADGLSSRGRALVDGFKTVGVDIEEVSSDLLQSLSETETSQGVLAVLNDHSLP